MHSSGNTGTNDPGQRKLLFIVNPKAGKKNADSIIQLINDQMPVGLYYQIHEWKNIDHFGMVVELARSGVFTDAIAVGGDGTVNHVARVLLNTNITLGIIPTGSGNGLARTLGISMNPSMAIKQILAGRTSMIDSGTVNGKPFFCTSGLGFDAHIGRLFATSKKRGLQTYIKITFSQIFRYKPKIYKLEFNGTVIERTAFLITVANAGQYGNDFYIAPGARINDGLFHIVIVKPPGVFGVVGLFFKIMARKADHSRSVETFVAPSLKITRAENGAVHYDGEPHDDGTELKYELKNASVKVIVGENFS